MGRVTTTAVPVDMESEQRSLAEPLLPPQQQESPVVLHAQPIRLDDHTGNSGTSQQEGEQQEEYGTYK